jgi:outer membrane protein
MSLAFTNSRSKDDKVTNPLNPSFNSRLSVTFTQPLLAGFAIDNTRNQLRTLSVQRQIADIQLLTTVENTKANVRTAYWALRSAIEQIEIASRGLTLAQRLFADNNVKVEIGTLAPIDTVQNDVAVANAEQTALSAQINWRTAELALKKLLANGPDDDIYRATINPTERPLLSVQSVDIPTAVQAALANRTDIVQSRRNLDISNLNLEVAKNLTKPQLDLNAGLNSTGQAGVTKDRNTGAIVTEAGYGDALSRLGSWNTSGYNVGMTFTLPFGLAMTQNRIAYARSQVLIQQAQATLKSQELTVSSDVTNAGLAVENTYKLLQAATKASQAAERNAEAEQTRFDVGMSTNYNVVQIQNQLTTARQTELTRLIAYINAIAEFDRVQKVGR